MVRSRNLVRCREQHLDREQREGPQAFIVRLYSSSLTKTSTKHIEAAHETQYAYMEEKVKCIQVQKDIRFLDFFHPLITEAVTDYDI